MNHRKYWLCFILGLLGACPINTSADEASREPKAVTVPRVSETDDVIQVHIGDSPVLTYNKSITALPDGIDSVFARSGYIHPIHTPSGSIVSGHYAADHPHQSGLFGAWVDTEFRGHHVDFWNKAKRSGRVAHEKVLSVSQSADSASFSVQLIHEDITDSEKPVTVLREQWDVVVHGQTEPGFVIDITSTQSCATPDALTVNEYRYGGMAIRGCDQWYAKSSGAAAKAYAKELKANPNAEPPGIEEMKHDFLTSESKGRLDGNHSRPNWVDLHGTVDGEMAGIAIFCNNQNFRSPQPVRLNPSKPYFCFAPNVVGGFEIQPGKPFISKYRIVVHDGPPQPEHWDRLWAQYNSKPD